MKNIRVFLNKETGLIVSASTEDLSIAEESDEGDDFSEYPDWQRESITNALEIIINWRTMLKNAG